MLNKIGKIFNMRKKNTGEGPGNYWPNIMLFFLIISFVSIGLYSFQPTSLITSLLNTFGRLCMVSTVGFASGWVLGFVFGIPKTSQESLETTYINNTNLEDISDWLTKVLIGVTLAQIPTFYGHITNFVAFLNRESFQGAIFTTLVVFFVFGTVFGYLWAREKLKRVDKFYGNLRIGNTKLKYKKIAEQAFDLITKEEPSKLDYQEAKELLNDAISQRGIWNKYEHGIYLAYYDFSRAICRIKLEDKEEKIDQDIKVVEEAKLLELRLGVIPKKYNKLIAFIQDKNQIIEEWKNKKDNKAGQTTN